MHHARREPAETRAALEEALASLRGGPQRRRFALWLEGQWLRASLLRDGKIIVVVFASVAIFLVGNCGTQSPSPLRAGRYELVETSDAGLGAPRPPVFVTVDDAGDADNMRLLTARVAIEGDLVHVRLREVEAPEQPERTFDLRFLD